MFDNRKIHLLFNSEHKLKYIAENGNSRKFTYLCPSSYFTAQTFRICCLSCSKSRRHNWRRCGLVPKQRGLGIERREKQYKLLMKNTNE